jgi:hypothetical protein
LNCKLIEKQLFQPEAPDDGDGAAAGIVKSELVGAREVAEVHGQADAPMEETEATAEAYETEL